MVFKKILSTTLDNLHNISCATVYTRTMYALILAAGRGERLRPLTDTTPKPMIELNGKPILWHQIQQLRAVGVTDIIFCTGHLADVVEDYFKDGSAHGIRAHYSRESTPLGTGSTLRQGLSYAPRTDDPIIVLNGDIITDASLEDITGDFRLRFAENPHHRVTVLTVPLTSPYGIVDTDPTGQISAFREKPQLPYGINGGVYAVHRDILDTLPEEGDHETTTFVELTENGQMSAVHTEVFWCSVDSHKDMKKADDHLASKAEQFVDMRSRIVRDAV